MRRRDLLLIGGGAALGAATAGFAMRNKLTGALLSSRRNDGVIITDALQVGDPSCAIPAQQIEGPYYLEAPIRSDIREDRAGLRLDLVMQVVDAQTCDPVKEAIVQIWHCDAQGRYSGYPEDLTRRPFDTLAMLARHGGPAAHVPKHNDKTYLRGAMISDDQGLARFTTILPGWYEPRVTHIHAKVIVGGTAVFNTQLYFPDPMLEKIYTSHETYKGFGGSPYRIENDIAFIQEPEAQHLMLRPVQDGDGIKAECKIGLA